MGITLWPICQKNYGSFELWEKISIPTFFNEIKLISIKFLCQSSEILHFKRAFK